MSDGVHVLHVQREVGLADEELLGLAQAAKSLPPINGKRHSPSTLWRWCRHGLYGVRLEHVRVGRTIATSRQALDRFFRALSGAGVTGKAEVAGHE